MIDPLTYAYQVLVFQKVNRPVSVYISTLLPNFIKTWKRQIMIRSLRWRVSVTPKVTIERLRVRTNNRGDGRGVPRTEFKQSENSESQEVKEGSLCRCCVCKENGHDYRVHRIEVAQWWYTG